MESSEAQDGYLLLEEKGRLIVRAESHLAKKQASTALDRNFEDVKDICKAIVRYVYRTGERVVLNNACEEDVFKDSPEVKEMQLHSVLCLPVNKQSRMIGVLYLENRLSDGVFTPKKTQMTELLTAQAAISLENVRLLDEMKKAEDTMRRREAVIESRNLRNRLEALEETQRATMNILEDFDEEKVKLGDAQHALMNILEDIDVERSRTEQAKVLLESANKELEAFSYSVSHDLQAPLRAISGFAEAVSEDYAPQLDDEGKRYLGIIQESSNKMMRLIDDLLSFSRLGRQQMTETDIDITGLAKEVYEELNAQTSNRKIRFIVRDCPAVHGDKAMMRQVLVNLIANAIKFTRTKQEAVIEFGYLSEPGNHAYYVRDNGVGFDMQYSDKLFGVFQRLHSASEFEGTGVGLALVNRIIARHGGTVWANGEIDSGATFFFSVPQED